MLKDVTKHKCYAYAVLNKRHQHSPGGNNACSTSYTDLSPLHEGEMYKVIMNTIYREIFNFLEVQNMAVEHAKHQCEYRTADLVLYWYHLMRKTSGNLLYSLW